MRCTDRVDIKLFHKLKLFLDFFACKNIAVLHICIMVINTLEFNRNTIEKEHITFDFNSFEACDILDTGFVAFRL